VASGLLGGEAEEGGGALVPVVGSAQMRSTAVSSGAWRRPSGKREERRYVPYRFDCDGERSDSGEYTAVSYSVVIDYG
jgi:hypothetical protein